MGDKVIYLGKLKNLDINTIGEISYIGHDWVTIVYKQFESYETDGNDGWKPKKGIPNKIYAHSANIKQIQLL